jgi:hypothetical protein
MEFFVDLLLSVQRLGAAAEPGGFRRAAGFVLAQGVLISGKVLRVPSLPEYFFIIGIGRFHLLVPGLLFLGVCCERSRKSI